jgi:hypothetical protein
MREPVRRRTERCISNVSPGPLSTDTRRDIRREGDASDFSEISSRVDGEHAFPNLVLGCQIDRHFIFDVAN